MRHSKFEMPWNKFIIINRSSVNGFLYNLFDFIPLNVFLHLYKLRMIDPFEYILVEFIVFNLIFILFINFPVRLLLQILFGDLFSLCLKVSIEVFWPNDSRVIFLILFRFRWGDFFLLFSGYRVTFIQV